jgi:hypothetical protein
MSNFHKSFGKNMHEKSTNKFDRFHRERLYLITVFIIFHLNFNRFFIARNNTMIRNRYPVGVTTKVFNDRQRTRKGSFRVAVPVEPGEPFNSKNNSIVSSYCFMMECSLLIMID